MPKALQFLNGGAAGIADVEKPSPKGNEILVRVVACGQVSTYTTLLSKVCVNTRITKQNPLDVLVHDINATTDFRDRYAGNTIGCDYAGIVEAVGPSVTRFKLGDRAAGFLIGNLDKQGAFAEFLVVEELFSAKIPDSMSFEEGATLGVAITTSAISLYKNLGLPRSWDKKGASKEYVMIYGASSAMGTMMVQVAKLSGFSVIALASRKNFELVQCCGADALFDYRDPDVASQVRQYTGNSLKLVSNCIPSLESCKLITDCISTTGGKCVNLTYVDTSGPEFREEVTFSLFMAFQIFNRTYTIGTFVFPPDQEMRDLAISFWDQVHSVLLPSKKLRCHPIRIIDRGLQGVLGSHCMMRTGQVSGWKFIARISDTPGE